MVTAGVGDPREEMNQLPRYSLSTMDKDNRIPLIAMRVRVRIAGADANPFGQRRMHAPRAQHRLEARPAVDSLRCACDYQFGGHDFPFEPERSVGTSPGTWRASIHSSGTSTHVGDRSPTRNLYVGLPLFSSRPTTRGAVPVALTGTK